VTVDWSPSYPIECNEDVCTAISTGGVPNSEIDSRQVLCMGGKCSLIQCGGSAGCDDQCIRGTCGFRNGCSSDSDCVFGDPSNTTYQGRCSTGTCVYK